VPAGTQVYVNLSVIMHLYCSARRNVKRQLDIAVKLFICGRLNSSSTLLQEPQISQP